MHRMDRASELCGPSRFDLNEDHHAAVLRHEIQLAERRAEVFGDDAVAFPAQIAFGLRLSFLPKEPPGVKNCHTLVRWGPVAEAPLIVSDDSGQSPRLPGHRSGDGSDMGHASQVAGDVLRCSILCGKENYSGDTTGGIRP